MIAAFYKCSIIFGQLVLNQKNSVNSLVSYFNSFDLFCKTDVAYILLRFSFLC